ncbi:MAG: hypothetical protein M9887_08165 [Chitinophagales bacterium]|nr:hypothetical protein [Chitinophagales bacterium]
MTELSDIANSNIQLDRMTVKIRLAEIVTTIAKDLGDRQPYLQRSTAITPNTNFYPS